MLKQSLFVLLVLFMTLDLAAQGLIRVTDLKTGEAVPYANVCFEPLRKGAAPYHTITSGQGAVKNEMKFRCVVAVSHIAYETFFDTLQAGEGSRVRLRPVSVNIDEVTVTAEILPRPTDKSIYRVKMIDRELINKKAATDLGELLKSESNIRVSQDASLGAGVRIQGLGGEHVKILVDGVPLNGRMNGNIDLGQLSLSQAEHVELVEGPMSVIYGSNALAGAINIITKKQNLAKLEAGAEAYYETVGVYNANAWFGFKSGKNSIRLQAERKFFGGWDPDDEKRNQLWKPKRQLSAGAHYVYRYKNLNIRLSANVFDEELRDKGAPLKPYGEAAYDAYYFTNRIRSSANMSWKISHIRAINLLAAYSWYERRKETWFKDLVNLTESPVVDANSVDTTRFSDINIRLIYNRADTNQKLNYQLGLDATQEQGEGKRIEEKTQEIGDYALFLNLNYRPCGYFEIQPGVRFAYNSKYDAPVVYSINTAWNISQNLKFRLSYARGFRAPGLKELYLQFVDVNHNIYGNPDLKAENSKNIQGGLSYRPEKSGLLRSTSIAFFYNDIDNIITLAQRDGAVYSYINLNHSRTLGGNLNAGLSITEDFIVQLGGGLTASRVSLNGEDLDAPGYFLSPEATATADVELFDGKVNVSAFCKFSGDLPQYYLDEQDVLRRSEMASYTIMDMNIGLPLVDKKLHLSFGAKNIFDVQDVRVRGAGGGGVHSAGGSSNPVGWGRSYFAGLSYKFQKQ